MPLPCIHREQVTSQVEPTRHLLENLDSEHPDLDSRLWRGSFNSRESTLQQLSPYVGKMKSGMARVLIGLHSDPGDIVLDPFSGSGVVSAHLSHAEGQVVNPIAKKVTLTVLLAVLVVLSFTLSYEPAHAQQSDLTIAEMRVSLWPEYDDPRLLVIYRGRFEDATGFPRTVTFPIPLGAEVNAAAYADDLGELFTATWQARQPGDFQLVNVDLPVPSFQLEFYHDAIQGTTDRRFAFTFQAPYPVEALRFDVQQPLKASNLQMDPSPTETSSDAAGFQYAIYDFGAVAQDQKIELRGSYVKTGVGTSIAPRQPGEEPSTPAEAPAAMADTSRRLLLLGAAVLLFGIAIAAGVLWIRGRPVPRLRRTGSAPRPPAPAAFCTLCGARLGQGDRFCRQCGAAVKSAGSARDRRRRSRRSR